MSYTHELKIWPEHFVAILEDRKRFEIRSVEDRSFDEGDLLHLREWDPTDPPHYTGREMTVKVTLVHAGLGTAQGYVVMGIKTAWVMASSSKSKLAAFTNSQFGTKWNGEEIAPMTAEQWSRSPFPQPGMPYLMPIEQKLSRDKLFLNSSQCGKTDYISYIMEKILAEDENIAKIERLKKHVAKLKRKLMSRKRRYWKKIQCMNEEFFTLQKAHEIVKGERAFCASQSDTAKGVIGKLYQRIELLKAEKDHYSLELRYYEDRAHKAEKELHRMGSHGSVVAIPASRFDELERAEKALKSLEGNVQPNRGES